MAKPGPAFGVLPTKRVKASRDSAKRSWSYSRVPRCHQPSLQSGRTRVARPYKSMASFTRSASIAAPARADRSSKESLGGEDCPRETGANNRTRIMAGTRHLRIGLIVGCRTQKKGGPKAALLVKNDLSEAELQRHLDDPVARLVLGDTEVRIRHLSGLVKCQVQSL